MANSSSRQRSSKQGDSCASSEKKYAIPTGKKSEQERGPSSKDPILSIVDILRIISTVIAVTLSLSYYVTSSESLIFNYPRPWFTYPNRIQAYLKGPLLLTPSQLSLHNGTTSTTRILLSLNHTIFDVSASPHHYGPGGSYSSFAGRDATRAFVTGCFREDRDRGADLRGVENMFIPVEDLSVEEEEKVGLGTGERKMRKERERREAKRRVAEEVERWTRFYRDSAKYFEVGRLVGWEGVEGIGNAPDLCEGTEKGRPKRSTLLREAGEGNGEKKKKVSFKPKAGAGAGKPV